MKTVKYSVKDINLIDLGTKKILKYPTPTKLFDVAKMILAGRHPVEKDKFIIEKECSFIMYILKGEGKVYANDEILEVKAEDVVVFPSNNKFAVEGEMEYITFDTPAFYMEQSEEV